MHERVPVGVVMKEGDRYVGSCDEVGATSVGHTVAEAFANLHEATWRRLTAQHCGDGGPGAERS